MYIVYIIIYHYWWIKILIIKNNIRMVWTQNYRPKKKLIPKKPLKKQKIDLSMYFVLNQSTKSLKTIFSILR